MRLRRICNGYWRQVKDTPSVWQWFRILRMHQHWTVFEAARWALWLAR